MASRSGLSSRTLGLGLVAFYLAALTGGLAAGTELGAKPDLFPAAPKGAWDLPVHPAGPVAPLGASKVPTASSPAKLPYFSDPMFAQHVGMPGKLPGTRVVEGMGVRTEAYPWLQAALHPHLAPPAPKGAQPLIYKPIAALLGRDAPGAAAGRPVVPVASLAAGPIDIPDPANPSTEPASWAVLSGKAPAPLPPILAEPPSPPREPADIKADEQRQAAALMEVQAAAEAEAKERLFQQTQVCVIIDLSTCKYVSCLHKFHFHVRNLTSPCSLLLLV